MPTRTRFSPGNPYMGDLCPPGATPELTALLLQYANPDGTLDFKATREVHIPSGQYTQRRLLTLRSAARALSNAWERTARRARQLERLSVDSTHPVRACALCGAFLVRLRIDRHPITFAPLYTEPALHRTARNRRARAARICTKCGHMLGWINQLSPGVSLEMSTLQLTERALHNPAHRATLFGFYGAHLDVLGAYLHAHGGYAGGYRPRGQRSQLQRLER